MCFVTSNSLFHIIPYIFKQYSFRGRTQVKTIVIGVQPPIPYPHPTKHVERRPHVSWTFYFHFVSALSFFYSPSQSTLFTFAFFNPPAPLLRDKLSVITIRISQFVHSRRLKIPIKKNKSICRLRRDRQTSYKHGCER